MLPAIKIGSIVVALILLLRFKVNLTLCIFLLSAYAVVLFGIPPADAVASALDILVEPDTIQLFIIIIMVSYVAEIQKTRKMFDRLVAALNAMIKDSRLVAMVAPAIVGLLPMPGGALVSAPLVDVSTKKMNLSAEFKTFMNFWFRHPWEYVWPVYAALPIFATLSGIPLKTIILYQAPFTLLNILSGVTVSFLYFKKHNVPREVPQHTTSASQTAFDFFEGVWPILLVILLYFVLPVPLYLALPLVALALTLVKKVSPKEAAGVLFSGDTARIVLLIASVMIFKRMIEISNAFDAWKTMEVSVGTVVFFSFMISFSMGFLTGVNNAFIVIAYPILLPIIKNLPADNYLYMSLYVYVIGFAGILLSPLHLCLVLTNEYFKSSLYKVFYYLTPPGLVLIAASTLLALML